MSDLTAGLAEFEAKNYRDAFRLLKPIADSGNAETQCIVGNMYELGLGLEKDVLEAVKYYKKSAAQGYGVASNNLGTIFTIGAGGLMINQTAAEKWYQKAREQGFLYSPNPPSF